MRNLILVSFVFLGSVAHSEWTDYVKNPDLKLSPGMKGKNVVPSNYLVNDPVQGIVRSETYSLKAERDKTGAIVAVSEIIRDPQVAGEGMKSSDHYKLRRTTLDSNGKMNGFTTCTANRQLSTWTTMFIKLFNFTWSNDREGVCRSISPEMCASFRKKMAPLQNHDIAHYSKACKGYADDMIQVFHSVMADVPKNFFDDQLLGAGQALSIEMKTDKMADYGLINMGDRMSKIPPKELMGNLAAGMGMFHELIEIEEVCNEAMPGRSAASAARAGAGARKLSAPKSSPTQ